MNTTSFQGITEALGWSLLHFLWQAIAIAAVLAIAFRLLRHRPSTARYAASLLSFAALLGAFVVTLALHWPEPPQPAAVNPPRPIASNEASVPPPLMEPPPAIAAPPTSKQPLPPPTVAISPPPTSATIAVAIEPLAFSEKIRPALPWAVGFWIIGVALFSLRFCFGWTALRKLQRKAIPLKDPAILAAFQNLLETLKITQTVRLLTSTAISVPMTMGWLKPAILLPLSLLTRLTPLELEAVLAHELAHIRRYDYLVNLV